MNMKTIIDKLKSVLPTTVIEQLPDVCEICGMNSPLRLAHFLAQCAHESGNFKLVYENLNYSAEGLLKVFPKYFDANTAKLYARNQQRIANRVYANRMGNRGESSGDGYFYRGRGYIQLTGHNNYATFAQFINDDNAIKIPDIVAEKYPLASAAFFFEENKLWVICDSGASDEVVKKVTKAVNGGVNGLDDRIKYFKKYYKLL